MNGTHITPPIGPDGIYPSIPKIQPEEDKKKARVKIVTRIKTFVKKTGVWVKAHKRVILISAETLLGLALIYYLNRRNRLDMESRKHGDEQVQKILYEFARKHHLKEAQIRSLKKAILVGEVPENLVKEMSHNKDMIAYLSFLVKQFKISGIRGLRARPTTRQLRNAVHLIAKEAKHNPEFKRHLAQAGVEAIRGVANPAFEEAKRGSTYT